MPIEQLPVQDANLDARITSNQQFNITNSVAATNTTGNLGVLYQATQATCTTCNNNLTGTDCATCAAQQTL